MRRKNFTAFLQGLLLLQLFIISVAAGLSVNFTAVFTEVLTKLPVLNTTLPIPAKISQRQADLMFMESHLPFLDSGILLNLGLNKMQTANIAENMIDAHLQVLAYAGSAATEKIEDYAPEVTAAGNMAASDIQAQVNDNALFAGQKVFIYCTHSAESYIPTSGKAKLEGERGLIHTVAQNMQKNISDQGLEAEFIDKIHDYPNYDTSYTNSRSTVKQLLENNDNIVAILDVHRDSLPGITKAATITAAGQKSAKILIIVGTDERKPHPEWKKNLAFAQALYKQGEKMYPGLIKGVTTKAGTYNQEFHPHALLLELGSDYNTLEEANHAARLFSEVFMQVLKEEKELQ